MKKKPFNQAAWNIYDSTFIQKIFLQNGFELSGYSKKVGFAKKNDKQALLINWIIRMRKAGYLDCNCRKSRWKIDYIEYYINKQPYKEPILRLKYYYYECLDISFNCFSHLIKYLWACLSFSLSSTIASSFAQSKVSAYSYLGLPGFTSGIFPKNGE